MMRIELETLQQTPSRMAVLGAAGPSIEMQNINDVFSGMPGASCEDHQYFQEEVQ